jgi:N utilization substance protein B
MAIPQQKFREVVFIMLYSMDMSRATGKEVQELLMAELAVTKKVVRDAQARVEKILDKQSEIDSTIAKSSLSYAFERIQTVERNILRLGIFEMLFDEEIPPKVAIVEAVRLARKFSTPESSLFVNAILDSVYKASLGEAVDTKQIDLIVDQLIESEKKAKDAATSEE